VLCVQHEALVILQVIKSARVMKKAVGDLIPFMEKEKEENITKMKEQGLEIDEKVKPFTADLMVVN